jgi:hypothetical protein
MTAIPELNEKTVQLHQWAVDFLALVQLAPTRHNVNLVVLALPRWLDGIHAATEQALVADAADTAQAVEVWQAQFRHVSTASYAAWWTRLQRLQAARWWANVKLQAKRMGW